MSSTAPKKFGLCTKTPETSSGTLEKSVVPFSNGSSTTSTRYVSIDLAVAGIESLGDRDLRVSLRQAGGHEGGFGYGVGAVVDGGVGDFEAGELGDHGLELEDGLEVYPG